jgi:hypothetical protein
VIGPDFICIGAIKGGTTWLYDQLRLHPDCWMPPIKEIHYFNRARKMQFPQPVIVNMIPLARAMADDPRDVAFFEAVAMCDGHRIETALYENLFAAKGDKLSGDVSPGYACLPETIVERIARELPGTKIIFMGRDPIARAWSQISMRWRQGSFKRRLLWSEAALRSYLDGIDMKQASYPSIAASTWARHFGPDRFRIFEYENTARDSERQRAEIFSFIGLDPAKRSGALAPDFNVKKGRTKLRLTPAIERWLSDYYGAECEAWEFAKNNRLKPWCTPWSPETRTI